MPKTYHQNLGGAIAKGAMWTVGSRMAVRSLGLVSIIILARILVPEDFGIVAKAAMIYSFLELTTQFGLENALIKKQNLDDYDYDTVWTIHLFRGTAIGLLLIVLAYPAARFFNETNLFLILWAFALVAQINGFKNIGTVDFRRNFQFHLEFKFLAAQKLAGFIVAISVALYWQTYWAFIAGICAASLTAVYLSFRLSPYRPHLSLARFGSMFDFSKWMLVHEISSAIAQKLDSFLLGRFSSSQILGAYTVANEIASTPTTEISMPVARAMLPGLARTRYDPAAFQILYAQTLSLVLLISLPSALGLSAIADNLTIALLGEKWINAAPVIKVLAWSGTFAALYSCSIAALIAFDKIAYVAVFSVVRLLLRLIIVPIGFYYYDFIGIAWAVLLSGAIHIFLTMIGQNHLKMLSVIYFLNLTWRILFASLFMFFAIFFSLKHSLYLLLGHEALIIAALILVGVITYLFPLFILWHISGRPVGPESTALTFIGDICRKLRASY